MQQKKNREKSLPIKKSDFVKLKGVSSNSGNRMNHQTALICTDIPYYYSERGDVQYYMLYNKKRRCKKKLNTLGNCPIFQISCESHLSRKFPPFFKAATLTKRNIFFSFYYRSYSFKEVSTIFRLLHKICSFFPLFFLIAPYKSI